MKRGAAKRWWFGACRFGCVAVALYLLAGAASAAFTSPATGITYHHGIAYLQPPSYPPDFTHFDYHNPAAPKGGRIRTGQMGNWDSFTDIPVTGRPVAGIGSGSDTTLLYDRLLTQAIDTPSDRYGSLAEGVAVAEDGAWIAFKLRDGPRWHDGKRITTDDYVFSFEIYTKKASPSTRQAMYPFERIEVLNESEIRYWVRESFRGNPVLPFLIGVRAVLPKHYWASRDITKTTLEPPLGSGPYRIKSYKTGRQITWERVPDYWGRDLPVNRGRYNFDEVVFDYFRDDQVLYEAAKGDLIDIREETVPVRWVTGYETPAVRDGILNKELRQQLRPAGLWWPIFWNMRLEKFQDIRIREVLWLMRDGTWSARVLGHGFYAEPTSFFHDSDLAHRGTPSARELELLEPLRDMVPPRVFTEEFRLKDNRGPGWHREDVKRALALFDEAGWEIRDNTMVHKETGEPFTIRLLAVSPALGASFIPYIQVLKKIGIEATVTSPEISNWLHRSRTGDFDGGAIWFLPDNTPGVTVSNSFSSRSAGQAYSPNWAQIQNPAVDRLIEHMEAARTIDDFTAAIRAIDRVLMWNFYFAPTMSRVNQAMVYWDRFGMPDRVGRLVRAEHIDTWWWDTERAARVATWRGTSPGAGG